MNLQTMIEMAKDARLINEDDWGTDRQVDAENGLFAEAAKILPEETNDELLGYCLKATTDEAIDECMRVIKSHMSES